MIVESVSSIVVAVRDRWKKTVIKEVTDPVTKHEYILTETYYFNRQTKTVPVESAEKTGNQIDLRLKFWSFKNLRGNKFSFWRP